MTNMTNSISSLKKQKSSSTDKLKKAMEQLKNNGVVKDTRFWQPEVDKAGNGYAVFRFLDSPAVDGEEGMPYVRLWHHGFQGPGGWYIENSLITINQSDPVQEYNTMLKNSGVDANKKLASTQRLRLSYISNIYMINDSSHPENNGKVFLYKYGKKIFTKIDELINPQFADEESVNPFDFWDGANFKLKIRNVDGYRNYDKSEFEKPSPLFADDAEIEKVWKSAYSLKQLLEPTNFKSYDQLKARLDRVVGMKGSNSGQPMMDPAYPPGKPATESPLDYADNDADLEIFKKLANE